MTTNVETSSSNSVVPPLDSVVSYLMHHGYTLTALELHMELLDKGIESKKLQHFIEENVGMELVAEKPKPNATGGRGYGTGEDSDIIIKQKDEQIAKLEYRLRLANEDIDAMKERVEKATKQVMPTAPSLPKAAADHAHHGVIHDVERRAINCLVKQYLLLVGYKLTAITMADEVSDQDLDDLEDVGLGASNVTLVGLYQHLFNQVFNKKDQDLEIELAVAHSEKKRLEGTIAQLQKELSSQAKSSRREVRKLKTMIEKGGVDIGDENGMMTNNNDSGSAGDRASKRFSVSSLSLEAAQQLEQQKNLLTETVQIVSDAIPKIKEGLLLKHREPLIPVTLQMIQLHPDPNTRDKLTHQLFNLIKKPEASQRKMIVDGFVRLAAYVGEERTGSELLTQCWEQVSDKHEERRILVADSCGALVRFVSADLRKSLILSILTALSEDRSELVRAATAKNLATVITVLSDADKASTIYEMAIRFMHDPSTIVADAVHDRLLFGIVAWSYSNNLFFSQFLPQLLAKAEHWISRECESLESKDKSVTTEYDAAFTQQPQQLLQQQTANSKAVRVITIVTKLLESIFAGVMASCPAITSSVKKLLEETLSGGLENDELTVDHDKLRKEADELVINKIIKSTAVTEGWPSLAWVVDHFVLFLTRAAWKVNPCALHIFEALFKLFSQTAAIFGRGIAEGIVLPPLEYVITKGSLPSPNGDPLPCRFTTKTAVEILEKMKSSSKNNNNSSNNNDKNEEEEEVDASVPLFVRLGKHADWHSSLDTKTLDVVHCRSRLLGPAIMGLAASIPNDDKTFLDIVSEVVESIALMRKGWGSIPIDAIALGGVQLCKQVVHRDSFVNVVADYISSQSASDALRPPYISILHRIIPYTGGLLLSKRIVPVLTSVALPQVSDDSNIQTQQLAISALGQVLCQESDVAIIDKVKDTLDKVMDLHAPAILQLTHTFASLIPQIRGTTRDTFILPKINIIAARNNVEPDKTVRSQLSAALFSAMSKFFDATTLGFAFNQTVETIITYLLPSIRLLLIDADAGILDHETSNVLHRMEGEILRSLPDDVRTKNLFQAHHNVHSLSSSSSSSSSSSHLQTKLPGAMKNLFSFDKGSTTPSKPPPAPPSSSSSSSSSSAAATAAAATTTNAASNSTTGTPTTTSSSTTTTAAPPEEKKTNLIMKMQSFRKKDANAQESTTTTTNTETPSLGSADDVESDE